VADLIALGGERFLAEVKITAGLDHPHVLTLIDSGHVGGTLFAVDLDRCRRRVWVRRKDGAGDGAHPVWIGRTTYRAGFADSAHLSRTFRRMYGIAAASIQLE